MQKCLKVFPFLTENWLEKLFSLWMTDAIVRYNFPISCPQWWQSYVVFTIAYSLILPPLKTEVWLLILSKDMLSFKNIAGVFPHIFKIHLFIFSGWLGQILGGPIKWKTEPNFRFLLLHNQWKYIDPRNVNVKCLFLVSVHYKIVEKPIHVSPHNPKPT